MSNASKPKPRLTVTITEAEYQEHTRDYNGVCLNCGEFTTDGGVEPDAEGYDCDNCGRARVVGTEQALLLGRIVLT